MKPSIAAKLASLQTRAREIDALLSDPSVVDNLDNYRKVTKESSEIAPVVERYGEYRRAEGDLAAAEEMAKDPQMRAFAEDEIREARAKLEAIEAPNLLWGLLAGEISLALLLLASDRLPAVLIRSLQLFLRF